MTTTSSRGAGTRPDTATSTWRTVDVVVAAVIAVAFGVVFWAWNLLYAATGSAFTFLPPLQGLMYGVWLLPGVLGNADSLADESHAAGLLEAPMYTKPASWRGHDVPETLRSGDHARIARWRRDQALVRTAARRPDLLAALPPGTLDQRDLATLEGAGFQIPAVDVAK